MKTLSKPVLLLLLCLTTAAGFSQSLIAKPKIFSQFPDVISCSSAALSNTFSAPAGKNITVTFSKDFTFSGIVTSNVIKYSNLQSITIQLPEYNNAVFHLSKQMSENKSILYTGRIINQNAYDGYELRRDEKGNYELKKIQTETVLQDCFIH